MYKYFCKLSLGLKFGEFDFGFTGYNMPMSKACKIWNKLSRSLSVIYVKRPVCLCLNPPSICMHIHVDTPIFIKQKKTNSFIVDLRSWSRSVYQLTRLDRYRHFIHTSNG